MSGLKTVDGPRAPVLGLALLLGLGLLSGCASKDHVAPPASLQAIENQFTPVQAWTADIGKSQRNRLVTLVPEVVGDRVYTVDTAGRLRGFELTSGRLVFDHALKESIASGVASDGRMIIVGTTDGRVLAVSTEDGEILWEASLSTVAVTPAAIGQGRVVVRAGDGRVFVLNATDGRRIWVDGRSVPPLSLQGQSRPVLVGDAVIVGYDSGLLAVHRLADGQVIWENQIALGRGRTDVDRMVDIDAMPLFIDGIVYALAYQGKLAAIDARNGQVIWSREFSGFNDFTADRHALYVTDAEGVVWAIDRRRGDTLWRQEELNNRFLTGPVLYRGTVVVGDFEGYLHFMDVETGQLIARTRLSGGEVISPLRVTSEGLLAQTRGGRLVMISIP